MQDFARRKLLKLGVASAVGGLASLALHGCGGGSFISPPIPPGLRASFCRMIRAALKSE